MSDEIIINSKFKSIEILVSFSFSDVKFGKWPLMEISKSRNLHRPRRPGGRRPFRGRHIGSLPFGPSGYNLGPPPPPGKLVLHSPQENKVVIHEHLQETLKQYAGNQAPSKNLPIIVKAPGPHPPPPPPGYKLASVGPPPDDGWRPGPPPLGGGHAPVRRPSRLQNMMQQAAYSGIFKNEIGTYIGPEFSPGPPQSGTYNSFSSDGSLITTHVNDDFVPAPPGPLSIEGLEAKPSVPPVIRIGEKLPENYTVDFAQRQFVAMKSPDNLERSGNDSPNTNEYDLGVNLGTKYEQGYGAKPPPSHPIVVTKFQKRGDVEPIVVKKLVQQNLPDTGLMINTNIVFSSPNISAPLGGKNSEHFKKALQEKQHIQKHRKRERPLDAQVKLLGRLFTKLQRLQPPKIAVPEDEVDESQPAEVVEGGGWGWGQDDDGDWKKVRKPKVDSPIMAVQIQTFSAPEVNSSDPDILESMAEFGNHDVEFGETDEIVHLMDTVMKHGSSRVNLGDLGSNPQEIDDNMLNWVRRHLQMTRDANQQAHSHGEKIANNQFKQYQTFVTPVVAPNGWSPGVAEPVDPKLGRRSFALTLTSMTGNMNRGDTPF